MKTLNNISNIFSVLCIIFALGCCLVYQYPIIEAIVLVVVSVILLVVNHIVNQYNSQYDYDTDETINKNKTYKEIHSMKGLELIIVNDKNEALYGFHRNQFDKAMKVAKEMTAESKSNTTYTVVSNPYFKEIDKATRFGI